MGKYGVKEVLDLKVYGAEGLLFEIDTMSSYVFTRDFKKGENLLVIEDALVDVELLNKIIDARYDNKNLRIKGKTKFRGLDGYDKDVEINITIAKIDNYSFFGGVNKVGFVKIYFLFPTKDAYGFQNANVVINE